MNCTDFIDFRSQVNRVKTLLLGAIPANEDLTIAAIIVALSETAAEFGRQLVEGEEELPFTGPLETDDPVQSQRWDGSDL